MLYRATISFGDVRVDDVIDADPKDSKAFLDAGWLVPHDDKAAAMEPKAEPKAEPKHDHDGGKPPSKAPDKP